MPLSEKQREDVRENWLKIFYGNSWSAESVAKYWLSILDQELDRREAEQKQDLDHEMVKFKEGFGHDVKNCNMCSSQE